MKLATIGAAVGYESESSFGKVFRRVMGISPGQYRRRTNESTRPVTRTVTVPRTGRPPNELRADDRSGVAR